VPLPLVTPRLRPRAPHPDDFEALCSRSSACASWS